MDNPSEEAAPPVRRSSNTSWATNYHRDSLTRASSSNPSSHRRSMTSGYDINRLLFEAIREDKIGDVKHWLSLGADIECVYEANTPLLEAVQYGRVAIVSELLANRAKVDSMQSLNGKSALHHAIDNRNHVIVDLLLKHGADITLCSPTGPHSHVSAVPPLIHAVDAAYFETVVILLQHNANPRTIYGDEGKTALHRAAELSQETIAEELLSEPESRAELLAAQDSSGSTAFDYAAKQSKDGMVKILLNSGARFDEGLLQQLPKGRMKDKLTTHRLEQLRGANDAERPATHPVHETIAAAKGHSKRDSMTTHLMKRLKQPFSKGAGKGRSRKRASSDRIDIAVICALPQEFNAIVHILDKAFEVEFHGPAASPDEKDTHLTGRIGGHGILLALVGKGKEAADRGSTRIREEYKTLKLAIAVGTCIAASERDQEGLEMLLGDTVITSRIMEFNFGTRNRSQFNPARRPSDSIENFSNQFITPDERRTLQREAIIHLEKLQTKADEERLGTTYRPPGGNRNRSLREEQHPVVHTGRIGTIDAIMELEELQDIIARPPKLTAIDTEGIGAWGTLPCIAIKGICDHVNGHNHDRWLNFAAASAAAVLKAFLYQLPKEGI